SELGSYYLPEDNENNEPNYDVLDDHSVMNTSLVSSMSLPSPAFSATSRSGDKGKTAVYRSKNSTNSNKLNRSSSSRSANDNINNTLQTTSNSKDNNEMNESGSTAASYIWLYVEKKRMPDGHERVFCKQPRCKGHGGWVAAGGGTGNIRKHLQIVHGFQEESSPASGKGPLPALLINQASRSRPEYNPNIMRNLMIRMVVRHKLPFTIFESTEVQEVIKYTASTAPDPNKIFFPSDSTVANY
ncbi:hypothetical protein BGX21_007324, partial [Mortierella sp. AD011]